MREYRNLAPIPAKGQLTGGANARTPTCARLVTSPRRQIAMQYNEILTVVHTGRRKLKAESKNPEPKHAGKCLWPKIVLVKL